MLIIKLIFHYQVREERVTFFFFKNTREHMRNESRNNKYFSIQKQNKTAKSGRREQYVKNSKDNERQNKKYLNYFFFIFNYLVLYYFIY